MLSPPLNLSLRFEPQVFYQLLASFCVDLDSVQREITAEKLKAEKKAKREARKVRRSSLALHYFARSRRVVLLLLPPFLLSIRTASE
jgi:hypothetical protein